MPKAPSVTDVIRVLDAGGTVPIRSSRTKETVALAGTFVLGLALLALLLLILVRSAEEDTHWSLFVFNLRIWALVIAVVGCLVGPPWAMSRHTRRPETLVLSRHGIAEYRGSDPTPRATLGWNEIREVTFERAPSPTSRPNLGPRLVTYHLTPEAAHRRGQKGPEPERYIVWSMYEVPRRQLALILGAAHGCYRRG